MISIAISMTALLFSISGFILGLLGFIQARASAQSTHTVQMQQPDLSHHFESVEEEHVTVPNAKLEETLLRGY